MIEILRENKSEIVITLATVLGIGGFFISVNNIPSYAYSSELIKAYSYILISILSLHIMAFVYKIQYEGVRQNGE